MLKEEAHFPTNYKKVDGFVWKDLTGRMAGSAQPGMFSLAVHDDIKLIRLQSGLSPQEAKVDVAILSELSSLYNDGIRTIYCVCDRAARKTELLKYLWESLYTGTQYLTQVNGVNIKVEDFNGFSIEQLKAIAQDAQDRISRGESILVHCRGGLGRTGTALSAIFMKMFNETDVDQAIAYIRAVFSPIL